MRGDAALPPHMAESLRLSGLLHLKISARLSLAEERRGERRGKAKPYRHVRRQSRG
jgi:hypothetical protein